MSKKYHLKLYKCIRDNGGWFNWSMILIDTVSCESKLELLKIERDYIENNNSILNCNIPSRTIKQWKQDNKEKLKQKKQQYYEVNKEYIKQYRDDNKEYIKEYRKEYREINKAKIKETMSCECGSIFRKDAKARHYKTKKHINFINNK